MTSACPAGNGQAGGVHCLHGTQRGAGTSDHAQFGCAADDFTVQLHTTRSVAKASARGEADIRAHTVGAGAHRAPAGCDATSQLLRATVTSTRWNSLSSE